MKFLALLLLPVCAFAADDDAKNLLDLARTAPPELFADAAIKLAETGGIAPGEAQTALLQEAFAAAGRAQEPFRLIPVPGLPPETRAAFRAQAGELGLDRLSLRARIVKLLSVSNPGAARRLFESIGHPAVDRTPCEDPLIPDASAYMEMAGIVARTGFSAEEKKDQRQVEFLQAALDGARSPAEVAAFARAISALTFAPQEWQLLLGAMASKMGTVAPDYRSFTISVDSMRAPLEELAFRARDQKFDAGELVRGFRRFLTQQMSGPRCDEDFGDARPAVEWFNASFRGNVEPIAEQEIEPSQRQGSFQVDSYLAAPEAKDIAAGLEQLKKSAAGTPEWRAMLAGFLRSFGAWTPAGAEADVFHQRLTILRGLLDLVPPGTERDQLLAQIAGLLQTSRVERLYPAEWLLEVKALAAGAGAESDKLLQAFRASGDPGLALFAIQY